MALNIVQMESLPVFIDGREYEITADDLWRSHTVSEFIHSHTHRSAREVCGEGGCGACSIIVTRPYRDRTDPAVMKLDTRKNPMNFVLYDGPSMMVPVF